MNIYLACTVRGDRGAVVALRALADALEAAGHTVLTRHLLDDDVESSESLLTETDVFERDIRWLTAADVLIADASGSSYGVGFEVGYVLGRSVERPVRVLQLYNASRRGAVSRLVTGNTHANCTTHAYSDTEDLLRFVDGFLTPLAELRT